MAPLCLQNLMQTLEDVGIIRKFLCKLSPVAGVHMNFQILPNSLSCLHQILSARMSFSIS